MRFLVDECTGPAMAPAQKGTQVRLMDADFYGPNIPLMMGVKGLPQMRHSRLLFACGLALLVVLTLLGGHARRTSTTVAGQSSLAGKLADLQTNPTATPTPTDAPGLLTRASTPTPTATPGSGGITNPDLVVTPAALPLQPVGTPFVDPVFGTTLRRVSNTSEGGGFETQIYSQLQAFSADNAYLLLTGSNWYVVRRTADLSLLSSLDTSAWNVPRWHPAQAHTVIHFDTNDDNDVTLQFTDVDTGVTTAVFTFPAQYVRVQNNQSFEEVSLDGRWLGGIVSRNDGEWVIFALDIQNRVLGTLLPIDSLYDAGVCAPDPVWGVVDPDWVGVSPLGNYLVVQWPRDGTERCSGLETFDLQTGAFVGRVYDGHQHGDLGVQPDGVTEFFMTFEMYHPSGSLSIGVRELPGTDTASEPIYVQVIDWFGEHISCQGPEGVCLVTTTWDDSGDWSTFESELFLQRTDGSVLRLTHHRSSSCGYWVQPRASISRDGRYVVFASDWGQETGADSCDGGNVLGGGDPYIIDLAAGNPPLSVSVYLPMVLKSSSTFGPEQPRVPDRQSRWLDRPNPTFRTGGR